jgi:hypothetical protein
MITNPNRPYLAKALGCRLQEGRVKREALLRASFLLILQSFDGVEQGSCSPGLPLDETYPETSGPHRGKDYVTPFPSILRLLMAGQIRMGHEGLLCRAQLLSICLTTSRESPPLLRLRWRRAAPPKRRVRKTRCHCESVGTATGDGEEIDNVA